MRKFFRTTEALVIVISAFSATMAGLTMATPYVQTLPIPAQVAFCFVGLSVSGVGIYILAEALERLALAIGGGFDQTLYTSIDRTFPERNSRILFYRLAVETNRDSVLLFDEPEANTFPMFTKLFAEQIAADDHGNTFFLTTHSPYLLGSLIEKTPREELAVVLCHMENFETKARVLDQNEVQELLDLGADAFFNLDRLAGE